GFEKQSDEKQIEKFAPEKLGQEKQPEKLAPEKLGLEKQPSEKFFEKAAVLEKSLLEKDLEVLALDSRLATAAPSSRFFV
ncbi:hypothetical protein DYH09_20930, partial [bacterium CPR1]|nr:hypothetical protein [bacterium CPR1]